MVDDVTIGPGNCRDGAPAPMDTRPTCQCPEPSRTQPGVACQRCDPRSLVGGGGCPLLRMSPPLHRSTGRRPHRIPPKGRRGWCRPRRPSPGPPSSRPADRLPPSHPPHRAAPPSSATIPHNPLLNSIDCATCCARCYADPLVSEGSTPSTVPFIRTAPLAQLAHIRRSSALVSAHPYPTPLKGAAPTRCPR